MTDEIWTKIALTATPLHIRRFQERNKISTWIVIYNESLLVKKRTLQQK